jgi:hypothetical protein
MEAFVKDIDFVIYSMGESLAGSIALTVLAVEEIADGFAAGGVGFTVGFALVGVHGAFGDGIDLFGFTAGRAAIGETGLTGLELKFFVADYADFDRERHCNFYFKSKKSSWTNAAVHDVKSCLASFTEEEAPVAAIQAKQPGAQRR